MTEAQVIEAPEAAAYVDPVLEASKLMTFDAPGEDDPEPSVAPETPSEETQDAKPVDEPEKSEETEEEASPEEPEQLSAPKRAKALAEMIRREKKLRQQNKALAEKTGIAESDREELARMRADPIAYMEEKNPEFYSEFTKRKLNDGNPTPDESIRKLREELREIKEQNDSLRVQTQEDKNKQIVAEAKVEISTLIDDDKYELTRLLGDGPDEVLKLIGLHYQQTGEDLTIVEAASMIESELESRMERLSQAKKLQSRLGGTKGATAKKTTPAGTRTLSNTMTSSAAPLDLSEMDDYEALQTLAKSIEWPKD
jgi:hypothetical protein